MLQYIFVGRVHPSQAQITLTPLWNQWMVEPQLRLDVNVTESHLRVDAAVPVPPSDFLEFRNDVQELSQAMVDAYMFSIAAEVVIELERVHMPDGTSVKLLPLFPGLRSVEATDPITADELDLSSRLIRLVWRSPHLRLALADTRRAVNSGRDTTFHSYRAVEAVRQHFVEPSDSPGNKNPSWQRMWTALNAERELVREFEESAKERRHGGSGSYTHDERRSALLAARQVIQLYADFLEREDPSGDED